MDKEQRQKRFQQKQRHVDRQSSLARTFMGGIEKNQAHRYAKRSWCNCGNPNCVMCMNPRKTGEVTVQERRQYDYANSFDEGVNDAEEN